jgi:RNA polymerase sigma factor (TIGR02999 family)
LRRRFRESANAFGRFKELQGGDRRPSRTMERWRPERVGRSHSQGLRRAAPPRSRAAREGASRPYARAHGPRARAFLRLGSYEGITWQGRAHFLAVAAGVMRRVLVDHARRKKAAKRGGRPVRVTLSDVASPRESTDADLIALNDVLERLAETDSRQCRVVEMHYFGGLSYDEIAAVLGVSSPTVKRDWRVARLWLRRALSAT